MRCVIEFLSDESGSAAVEYAMVAGAVGLSMIGGSGRVGGGINAMMHDLAYQVELYLS